MLSKRHSRYHLREGQGRGSLPSILRWVFGYDVAPVVSLGELPPEGSLVGVPTFSKDDPGRGTDTESSKEKDEGTAAEQGTCTLMSLFASQSALVSAAHAKKVWLGDGLGSVQSP